MLIIGERAKRVRHYLYKFELVRYMCIYITHTVGLSSLQGRGMSSHLFQFKYSVLLKLADFALNCDSLRLTILYQLLTIVS